jgi:SRSO17 transposase
MTVASIETTLGLWSRGLLIRRNISDNDLALFHDMAPPKRLRVPNIKI